MNAITLSKIQETAKKFADTAKRVNISSRLRTNHIREALASIIYLQSIGSNVIEDVHNVAYKDNNRRECDLDIQSMCVQLKKDIKKLTKLAVDIEKSDNLNKETMKKIIRLHNDFKLTINDVIQKMESIISNDNEIIKKDEEILTLKTTQQHLLETLQVDTQKSCIDAVRAIKGSRSNLLRGLKMVQNFEQIESLIEFNDLDALSILYNNTKVGWEIAESVNQSSISQFQFAEKVYDNTQMLHEKSKHISNLVNSRQENDTENINSFNDITNMLSEQLIKHMYLNDLLKTSENSSLKDEQINKLATHINDIIISAESIIKQNTQNRYYSESEFGNFDMIQEENYYYDRIIEEIEFMTETTRYPIEGSKDNITNGQILEQLLVSVFNEMGIPVLISQ